jgi:hypothetical protein
MITSEMVNAAFVNAMDKLGVAASQGLRFSVYDSLDVQVRDLFDEQSNYAQALLARWCEIGIECCMIAER